MLHDVEDTGDGYGEAAPLNVKREAVAAEHVEPLPCQHETGNLSPRLAANSLCESRADIGNSPASVKDEYSFMPPHINAHSHHRRSTGVRAEFDNHQRRRLF